jgi:hypothetical protein
LAARWAHNPKVIGSSPVPATKKAGFKAGFFIIFFISIEIIIQIFIVFISS